MFDWTPAVATVTVDQSAEPLLAAGAWLAEANGRAWDCAPDDELLAALKDVMVLRNQLDAFAGQIAVAAEGTGAVNREGRATLRSGSAPTPTVPRPRFATTSRRFDG